MVFLILWIAQPQLLILIWLVPSGFSKCALMQYFHPVSLMPSFILLPAYPKQRLEQPLYGVWWQNGLIPLLISMKQLWNFQTFLIRRNIWSLRILKAYTGLSFHRWLNPKKTCVLWKIKSKQRRWCGETLHKKCFCNFSISIFTSQTELLHECSSDSRWPGLSCLSVSVPLRS